MRPVLVVCALAVLGCGRQTAATLDDGLVAANGETASDSGTADAGPPLWPVDATRVEATRRGGFPTPYCDTDAGVVEGATYVLTLPEGRLTYSVCTGYQLPHRYWSGALTLDAGQLARFEGAMGALTRSDRLIRGADANVLVLELDTPQGPLRYEDDFYAVLAHPDTVYVTGTHAVFEVLDNVAGIRW